MLALGWIDVFVLGLLVGASLATLATGVAVRRAEAARARSSKSARYYMKRVDVALQELRMHGAKDRAVNRVLRAVWRCEDKDEHGNVEPAVFWDDKP